jgi:methanol metabolism-related c-type cytochrome
LTACKEKKSEETPAPPPAAETAPAPAAETPAVTPAPAETPATPATPAPDEKKSDAAPAPAPSSTEPAKTEESSPMTPETPAATPEPEKKSEAPSPSSTTAAAPAADDKPQQSADAATAPAAAPAATETKAADAKPAEAPAADAKPADDPAAAGDIKDRTSPPDPVSELAKSQGFKFTDGRYRNKDGDPQYVVTKDYMVDWGTWNGFRRYHDACHVCHGPNALGSTFAPALADSLKTMDYSTFVATVSGGRTVNRAGTTYVMPAFGSDRNIMCYIDDIYTYIKARSTDAMPPGRPNGREDIAPETQKAANDCTG